MNSWLRLFDVTNRFEVNNLMMRGGTCGNTCFQPNFLYLFTTCKHILLFCYMIWNCYSFIYNFREDLFSIEQANVVCISNLTLTLISITDLYKCTKSQLTLKGLFVFFNSSKRRTDNFCPSSRLGQKLTFSSPFFGRIDDTKISFLH